MCRVSERSLAALLICALLSVPGLAAERLRDYQWKQRLLLIQASDSPAPLVKQLAEQKSEIDDRDLIWFLVTPNGIKSNWTQSAPATLRDEIKETLRRSGDASILLIGKDGGIKAQYTGLDLPAVFQRIDSMPMRQEEMSNQ